MKVAPQAADLEPDLLGHALCLVGQHHRVTVTAAFLPRVFPQLKLLQAAKGTTRASEGEALRKGTSAAVAFLTVASLLSISGPAFSTAVF